MILVRTISVNNAVYVRSEDIQEFMLDLAAGEETDVRERIEACAYSFGKLLVKPVSSVHPIAQAADTE